MYHKHTTAPAVPYSEETEPWVSAWNSGILHHAEIGVVCHSLHGRVLHETIFSDSFDSWMPFPVILKFLNHCPTPLLFCK